jgi:hypothetical protein
MAWVGRFWVWNPFVTNFSIYFLAPLFGGGTRMADGVGAGGTHMAGGARMVG